MEINLNCGVSHIMSLIGDEILLVNDAMEITQLLQIFEYVKEGNYEYTIQPKHWFDSVEKVEKLLSGLLKTSVVLVVSISHAYSIAKKFE